MSHLPENRTQPGITRPWWGRIALLFVLLVSVTDSGPGIPPDQREAIFNKFTRLDESQAAPGHGLGLAIARRIARLRGGDLMVTGKPAMGSTFTLWLPLEDASQLRGP